MANLDPTVGRIVHYRSFAVGEQAPACRAAIVTAVWVSRETVDLTVFPPVQGQPFGATDIRQAGPATAAPGESWHWPEREG